MSAGSTTQKYGTILTATGKAAVANAVATNTLIAIKYIALGDGGGSEYYPGESQTALKNQVYQMAANSVYADPDNPNWIIVEGLIPESAGGFTIREAAIKTEDGKVIAVGSYPSSYKPKLEEGSAVGIGFKFILEVTNADVVNMNIDPSTVYATIQYVNNRVSNHASETNVHGGTYLKTPRRLMYRNEDGRCQVADPTDPADATPMHWVEKAIAKSGGILPWDETKTYAPLPHLVWGSDNMIYVAEQPSGPDTAAGPQDPTTTTGYWLGLGAWLNAQGGGGSGGGSTAGGVHVTPLGGCDFLDYQTPPGGWMVANGALITSASIVVPELVAALQLPENAFRLLSEAEWQAQSASEPWNGIGGVKGLVLNLSADTVRLPDIRGMYMEAAGFDGLSAGGVHGDAIRNIPGRCLAVYGDGGLFTNSDTGNPFNSGGDRNTWLNFNPSKVVPTANKNQPRAFGVIGCVYVGPPAS